MRLSEAEYKIHMSYDDVYQTAWDIAHTLKNSVENHYVNFENGKDLFEKQEAIRIGRMKFLFNIVGMESCYRQVMDYDIKKCFELVKT